jgi:S-adenosyl methyltransferase
MTVRSPKGRGPGDEAGGLQGFDVTVANPARIWDYWLGGKDNFAVDREAAQWVQEALPWLPDAIRGCRHFLGTSVHALAAEHGIRQFLDVGTGLPTVDNTHEVAQRVAPSSRIVYVDSDPVVAAHARALLIGSPEGVTEFVQADLRDPELILSEAAVTLDFTQPVAIVLTNIVHFLQETDDPYGIVSRLMSAVPSGSFLVMVHGASDLLVEVTEGTRRYNEVSSEPLAFRTREQVTRFFDGLEILDTGSGDGRVGESAAQLSYFGIGRKP